MDFCTVEDGKPTGLVEAKLGETDISPTLRHFSKSLSLPGIQLTRDVKHERQDGLLELRRASSWLAKLEPRQAPV